MVRFNPKARLDTSRVNDAGSGGGGGGGLGGGGMRLPIPTGKGGIGGIVVLVVIFLIAKALGVDLGLGGDGTSTASAYSPARLGDAQQGSDRYAGCKTGADAQDNPDCARVAVENSLTDYWDSELGGKFHPEKAVVTFSGSVNTGCGGATSDVGPFYCPSDETIYLDTTFFRDVYEGQLGGKDAPFVEAYVLAHEYGHHISNLLGFMTEASRRGQQGPQSGSVRLELQADCYAGLWANHATSTEDAAGQKLLLDLTDQDIAEALDAAKTVGDDYIQKRSGGRVDEEGWTHGSSAQRQKWFNIGYEKGDLDACDTFSVDRV